MLDILQDGTRRNKTEQDATARKLYIFSIKKWSCMMTCTSNILFQSACVLVTFSQPNRHLTIQALSSGPVDETSVDKLFEITEDLMQNGNEPFMTTWNLKNCRTPSRQIVFKCLQWALNHKSDLNSKNKRLAIVSGSSPVNAIVKLVLKAFGPSCPTFVGTNEESAFRFMEENERV